MSFSISALRHSFHQVFSFRMDVLKFINLGAVPRFICTLSGFCSGEKISSTVYNIEGILLYSVRWQWGPASNMEKFR